MESVPTAIVYQMVRTKQPDMVHRLRYKEKSYILAIYTLTKIDLAKISRVEDVAALYIGAFVTKGREYDMHAKSISLEKLREILSRNKLMAVLSREKGTTEMGTKKFSAVISLALTDASEVNAAKRKALQLYIDNKEAPDTQRTKLYKWEWNDLIQMLPKTKSLSVERMSRIMTKIITAFNLPKEKIHVMSSASRSKTRLGVTKSYRDDMQSDPNFIVVDVHDSALETLIHEASHMLVWFYNARKDKIQAHGPEFAGTYAYLLSEFYGIDEKVILDSMKQYGLKVKKFTGQRKSLNFDLAKLA